MFKAFSLALTVSFYATATAGAQTVRVVWQPLEKQSREPDTLYLLDVDAERKLTPGDGGMIPCQPGEQPWTKLVPCEGKYWTGLKCLDRRYGFMWRPSSGLMAPNHPWAILNVFRLWSQLVPTNSDAVSISQP